MPAIQIADLNNAKTDVEHIGDVANSTALTAVDRLGRTKRTLAGIDAEAEARMDAIDSEAVAQRATIETSATTQRTNIQSAADAVLAGAGYAPPVAYAAGMDITLQTQTVEYLGEVYAPKVADLPFTTSGTFESAKFRLLQGVSGADLAADSGSAMVGTKQSGTGSVLRTVEDKLREVAYSPNDIGAVMDGSTDDRSDIVQAVSNLVTTGGTIDCPAGSFYVDGGFGLTWPVNLRGKGAAHHAFYTGAGITSTVLKIEGGAGDDCLLLNGPIGKGNQKISDLSIYKEGTAAINAVVGMEDTLHIQMDHVEIAGHTDTTGIGLHLRRNTSGVIYGNFSHLKIINIDTALKIEDDCNALNFYGCALGGTLLSLHITGTTHTPLGNSFFGCPIEGTYSADMEHEYLAPGTNLVGYPVNTAGLYVVKCAKIEKAQSTMFAGGYFEIGGTPATYNDGTNGTLTLVPVVEVGADAVDTIFDGVRFSAYLLDRGSGTKVISTQEGLPDYWTKRPPTSIRRTSTATAISAATWTAIPFALALNEDSGNFTWNGANTVCTVAHPGKYRVKVQLNVDAMGAASARNRARIVMGGQAFNGPNNETFGASTETGLFCEAELTLTAGQTIEVSAYTSEASALIADATYNVVSIEQC